MVHEFEKLGLNTDLPFTKKASGKFMLLPMNTSLDEDDIEYICKLINDFYKN